MMKTHMHTPFESGAVSMLEEFETVIKEHGRKNMTNFAHMIWPTLELVGCASAKYDS